MILEGVSLRECLSLTGFVHALHPMREPVIGGEPQSTNSVIDGVVVVVVVARISLVDESVIGGSPVDEFLRLEPKSDFLLGRLDGI